MDQSFDDKTAKKNSESALDNRKEKIDLDEHLGYMSNEHIDANPDVIENIVLNIQPIKILDQSKELEVSKDFYEDSGNRRYNYSCSASKILIFTVT